MIKNYLDLTGLSHFRDKMLVSEIFNENLYSPASGSPNPYLIYYHLEAGEYVKVPDPKNLPVDLTGKGYYTAKAGAAVDEQHAPSIKALNEYVPDAVAEHIEEYVAPIVESKLAKTIKGGTEATTISASLDLDSPSAVEIPTSKAVVDAIDPVLEDLEEEIASKATRASTLAGYGITDAKIENGVITLGNNTITPTTSEALQGYVPKTRKVNNKALSADITITKADIGLGSVVNNSQSAEYKTKDSSTTKYFTQNGANNLYNELNAKIESTASRLPYFETIVLSSSGWSNNRQTISVSAVLAESFVKAEPVPGFESTFIDRGIKLESNDNGEVTFSCTSVPESNITVNLEVFYLTPGLEKKPVSIAISSLPIKKDYVIGDTFNPAGMSFITTFSTLTVESISYPNASLTYVSEPFSSSGIKNVTFTYTYNNISVNCTYIVEVEEPVSSILDENSWATISRVSERGLAENYWDVGDLKKVSIVEGYSTVWDAGTYYFRILGIDHNAALESPNEHRIHFGLATNLSGREVAFGGQAWDTFYQDTGGGTGGTEPIYGTYEHSWNKGCNIKDLCIRFKNCLHNDVKSVIKSVIKGQHDQEWTSFPTSTVFTSVCKTQSDEVFIPSNMEIFGTPKYSGSQTSDESTVCRRYEYYTINDMARNRRKYLFNGTDSDAEWWLRSLFLFSVSDWISNMYVCFVDEDGDANYRSVIATNKFVPCFTV